jgi:undecaprenyl-diphosphatase
MTTLHAIILGIIEGIAEFLPISSTGHLILVSHIMGIPNTDALKSFEIAIQLGAILAVFLIYFKKFIDIEILKKLFVAFLPTGVLGFTLYKLIKGYLIGNPYIVVATLFIGGVVMLIVESWYKKNSKEKTGLRSIKDLSYSDVIKLGLFQSIAMIPGVSRSGSTIIGGLAMGIPRSLLAEFTFLLAVPTMAVATLYDILKNYEIFSKNDISAIAVGFTTSFVVAMFVVKWLLSYIKKHDFTIFAWYRIALSIVFTFVFLY